MPSYPTIVPQTDITRDGLNQFDQAVQQGNLDAFDAAAKAGQDQLASYQPHPPNGLTPDDPAAAATAKAVASGADPANLARARQEMGSQAYTNLCEKFVENASGKDGQFASAIDAWNQQPDRQQRDASQIRPGDLVYYGPSAENGYYGHAAIYSGQGKVISATSNGVKETPAQGYFGAPMLGYIPAGDNQQLAPSPMTAPQWGPNYQPPSVAAPGGENYGHLSHPLSTEDGLSLFDRAVQQGNDTLDQIQSTVGQTASGLGSAVQGAMSKVTGISDGPVGPDNVGIAANTPALENGLRQAPGAVVQAATEPVGTAVKVVNALNAASGNGVPPALTPEEAVRAPGPNTPAWGPNSPGASAAAPGLLTPQQASATEIMGNVALGGPEGLAAPLAAGVDLAKAGVTAAKAAPSMADAFRAVADHLEGKGIGLLGPGAGERAPSDVVAGMGVNPQPLVDAAGGAKYELTRLLAPAKNTPPEVQSALADFANVASPGMGADVQAESLARKVQDVLGPNDNVAAAIHFEKTGEYVPNPTPEQAAVAQEVRDFTQRTGDAGRLAGFIKGDVAAGGGQGPSQYLMHLYDDTAQQAAQAGGRGLNPRDLYSFQRQYPTLEDAIAAGKSPVDSVSQPIQAYAGKVLDSQAKVDLVNNLKALPNPPVMDMPPAGTRLPDGFVAGAGIAPQFQGVAFTQPVAEALGNILKPGLGNTPVLGGIMKGTGLLKENLFLGSGFHGVQEIKQSLFAQNPIDGAKAAGQAILGAVSPKYFDRFRLANSDAVDFWANHGILGLAKGGTRGADIEGNLTSTVAKAGLRAAIGGASGASLGYTQAVKAGDSDGDVLKKALLGGAAGAALSSTVGPQITKAIFEREIPMLKVVTAENLMARKMDPLQVATFVNQTYGGQNLAAIARSRAVQDVLRLGVLSPDWWEGWARQIGSGAAGFVGQGGDLGRMSRGYWLRNATIQGAFGLEGLNYAINGHLTNDNEPGHQFDLETTGLIGKNPDGLRQYIDILGPVRPLVQLAASRDVGQFTNTRTSLPVSLAIQDISNKDFAGKEVVPSGTGPIRSAADYAVNAGQRVAPVGLQQAAQTAMTDQNAPDLSQSPTAGKTVRQTLTTLATGMRQTAGPAPATLYQQRNEGLATLAERDPGGVYAAFKTAGMDAQFGEPPGSYKQIVLNPDEQLAWQQTRVNFLNTALKPGELAKIQALKPGERDAVMQRLLSDADKVAAGTVLSKLSSTAIDARMQTRGNQGKPAARSVAQQQPYNQPQFTAPAAR